MIALVLIALVALIPRLVGPMPWEMDGLFYEAQVHELQGESEAAALRQVFTSKAAAQVPGAMDPHNPSVVTHWAKYSARFYRRRWIVPAMGAALYPLLGDRSLLYVSVLGYITAGLLLFALLRRRFSDGASFAAAAVCLLLPPMRGWSGLPMTDSWGLALEIWALLAALVALERGGRWIVVWFVSMLILSFTRDATFVLLAAVGLIALMTRTRRSALILGAGIAASIPAPVLFGAPFLEQLAYNLNSYHVPGAVNWSYILSHYPHGIWTLLRDDITAIRHFGGHPVIGYAGAAAIVASVAYMTAVAPHRDAFFTLQKGAIVGAALTVALAVNFTDLRIELVFVPAVAAGMGFTFQRLANSQRRALLFRFFGDRAPIISAGRRA